MRESQLDKPARQILIWMCFWFSVFIKLNQKKRKTDPAMLPTLVPAVLHSRRAQLYISHSPFSRHQVVQCCNRNPDQIIKENGDSVLRQWVEVGVIQRFHKQRFAPVLQKELSTVKMLGLYFSAFSHIYKWVYILCYTKPCQLISSVFSVFHC